MRKYTLTENLVFDADIFETCTEFMSHEIAEGVGKDEDTQKIVIRLRVMQADV